jgi:rare lipoprotein A
MMPSTRQLTAVVGVWLGLWLTGSAVQADPWYREHGLASYYGKGFHGRKTASGDRFSQHEMTAAHRQLPLGTKVMVENRETGEQVEVKITDRGPYADKNRRIIDLSKAAANSIGLVEEGIAPVRVVVTEEAVPQKKRAEEEIVYEVQVGAFEQGEQAAAVLEQVQGWFPKAYIAPRQGPAGEYYRVRVGPFATKKEAQHIASGLQRGGHRVFLDEVPETALPPEASQPASNAK